MPGSLHLLRVGTIAAMAFLAGIEWHLVFGWGPVVGRVAAAAAVPVAVAVVSHRLRPTRPGAGVALSLVLLAWFLAVGALHDAVGVIVPTSGAPGGIVDGLVNGWAGILSVPLPVPALGEYLVLPVTLTWLAGLAGSELALRSRRPLAGAVPPALAYALTLVFGIGAPGSRLVTSSAFLAAVLVLGGATAHPIVAEAPGDRSARRRRAAEVGAVLAVVVVLAALLGPSLPFVGSNHPYDPRTSRVPPETPASAANPLDQLSVWALDPHGPPLLTVHWSGPPQTLRMAVLDRYNTLDGWTASSRFSSAGSRLPPVPSPATAAVVRADIRIDSLPGPWLPGAVQPVRLTGTRALVDPSTGVLVAAGSTRGIRYQVTSDVPSQHCTLDQAVPFAPGTAPVVPAAISSLATLYAGGATSPCARATDLAAAFAQHFSFNPKAPPGSNIQVLLNFLKGPKDQSGGTGTYEQAAASCALMAEALGMRARVVVGFHAGHPLGGRTYRIDPNDAFAWIEVDFAGAGWVPFYPGLRDGPTPPADKTDQSSSQLLHKPNQPTSNGIAPREQATHHLHTRASGSTLPVVGAVLVILLVIALLALLVAALVVRTVGSRRRRRRREQGDPRQQVIGAWEDSLDALATVGVRSRPSETVEQVVSSGAARLGDDVRRPLDPLGELSNAALYSNQDPDAADAGAAWEYADSVSVITGEALSRWGRLRRAVDLRVIFRRRAR